MFDFSPTGIVTALAVSFWTSLSPQTAIALMGALAAAVLAGASRSPASRGLFLGLAVALGVSASVWQGAATDGARRMMARDHALALQAERERTAAAEAINRDLAEQATRDLAEAQADTSKMKGIDNALAKDGRRDGVCVDRGLARRLRAL